MKEESAPPPTRPADPTRVRNTLLAILAVIVGAFALRETTDVTLPLAFGIFCAALMWPLMRLTTKLTNRSVGAVVSTLVFLAMCGGFVGALVETGKAVETHLDGSEDQIAAAFDQVRVQAASLGVPLDSLGGGETARRAGERGLSFLAGAFLVVAFMSLALYEARDAADKVRHATYADRARRFLEVADRVSRQFRRYFWVRTLVGAITGVLVAGGAWAIGLEMWWLWGLLNFLLNYIPTVGSVVGVIPPALYAMVQFGGDWAMVGAAIAVVGGVQLVMGAWVDPLIQGKALSLSPLVVLLSIALWGWIWGIAGALIAVPMTVLVVLVTREHASTRWIATMLATLEEVEDAEGDDDYERAPGETARHSGGWAT